MSNREKIIDEFKKSPADSGSARVQEALLTTRIKALSGHFSRHKKDFHSMRGLVQMVSRRKKLLSYIKRKSHIEYGKLLKALDLRK